MVIRTTPMDITKYWLVDDSQENLILQENGLMPRHMDSRYTYYLIDENFVNKYLEFIDKYPVLTNRKTELKERR